jgi:hypothetical protein
MTIGDEVKSIVEFIKKDHFDLLTIDSPSRPALRDCAKEGAASGLVRLASCSALMVK